MHGVDDVRQRVHGRHGAVVMRDVDGRVTLQAGRRALVAPNAGVSEVLDVVVAAIGDYRAGVHQHLDLQLAREAILVFFDHGGGLPIAGLFGQLERELVELGVRQLQTRRIVQRRVAHAGVGVEYHRVDQLVEQCRHQQHPQHHQQTLAFLGFQQPGQFRLLRFTHDCLWWLSLDKKLTTRLITAPPVPAGQHRLQVGQHRLAGGDDVDVYDQEQQQHPARG